MNLLFTALSLYYVYLTVQTLRTFHAQRATLFDERVTPAERRLFDRGAFFLLIPIAVLLHELGHALATWQVGGEVLRFRWFVFWGYVLPGGHFTPLQDWWIAFSGNLVSVLLGFAAFGASLLARKRPWRYFLYSFARLQFFYSLIFYPIFSLLTRWGDWMMIYGVLLDRVGWLTNPALVAFTAPMLLPWNVATLIGHVGLFALLWAVDRNPSFRQVNLLRYAPAELLRAIEEAQAAPSPDSLSALAMAYARYDEPRLAETTFEDAAARYPRDPIPVLNRARFEEGRQRPDKADACYEQALARTDDARLRAIALEGAARTAIAREQPARALERLDEAIALRPTDGALRLQRGRVRRRLGDEPGARADLEAALAAGGEAATAAREALDEPGREDGAGVARS